MQNNTIPESSRYRSGSTPSGRRLTLYQMTLCSLFTTLIIVGAFIRIPFPVVPLTLQTLFVILGALLFGPYRSSLSVALYLAIGLIGFPVFTKGGGPGYLLQPTFGYLIGFLFASLVVGKLSTLKKNPGVLYYWGIGILGTAVVYLTGMIYLYFVMKYYVKTPVGFLSLFTFQFLITAAGDVLKCFAAAFLAKRLKPLLKMDRKF